MAAADQFTRPGRGTGGDVKIIEEQVIVGWRLVFAAVINVSPGAVDTDGVGGRKFQLILA